MKHLEILTLLSDGSGSLIVAQKKQERMVHDVSVGSLLVLVVLLCWHSDSMAKNKKVGVFGMDDGERLKDD